MTAPRRSAGARHWIKALSGTKTSPAEKPSSAIEHDGPAEARPDQAKSQRGAGSGRSLPGAPGRTRPWDAESRPATTEPAPMPMPIAARGSPVCHSGRPSVFMAWARSGGGIRLAIDQTKTCPAMASRRIRSPRMADQPAASDLQRTALAAGGGNPGNRSAPRPARHSEITRRISPPSQGCPR